jgi:hypothetical protein
MRQMRVVLTLVLLASVLGWAQAGVKLTIAGVGFDGYYRARTVVPIAVRIENTGKTVAGEFHITTPDYDDALLPDTYRLPYTIPGGTKQLRVFYVVPRNFSRNVRVSFYGRPDVKVDADFKRCQELYDNHRLLVVVDDTGTSLSYLHGLPLDGTPDTPMPRPWDLASGWQPGHGVTRSYGGPPPKGEVVCAYVTDARLLPANPEAYGSVAALALMANVTENALTADAQKALPAWVATGGHLLIAGGGVVARLQAPFFAALEPRGADSQLVTNVDGRHARTAPYGTGRVTWLDYDPNATATRDATALAKFYGKLIAREPQPPLPLMLRDALNAAIGVRNLRPPNLQLIVGFLLIYLVMLVPLNYFILKRLDKRELAWVTTPAIVLIFTVAAYGVGYLTKGNRLVMNVVSLVETGAGQGFAEATSQLLVFSPARTNYRVALGETALVVRDTGHAGENPAVYGQDEVREDPLGISASDEGITLDRLHVDMWAFRQLVMGHSYALGRGIYGRLVAQKPGMPTGTITNGTPYSFTLCDLYQQGSYVASFSMTPGQRIDLAKVSTSPQVRVGADAQSMLDSLREHFKDALTHGGRLTEGAVLVCYSVDPHARVPLTINARPPTTAMTVVVVHL